MPILSMISSKSNIQDNTNNFSRKARSQGRLDNYASLINIEKKEEPSDDDDYITRILASKMAEQDPKKFFLDGGGKIKCITGLKKASQARKVSTATFADMLLYAFSDGEHRQRINVGNPVDYLKIVLSEEANEFTMDLFVNMLNGRWSQKDIRDLKNLAGGRISGRASGKAEKPWLLQDWTIKSIRPEVEGTEAIAMMARKDGSAVFLDTEDAYHSVFIPRENEADHAKLALIQIADTVEKEVLLVRVHRCNQDNLEKVRVAMTELKDLRGIKSFGDASVLGIELEDIQPQNPENPRHKWSLKNATKSFVDMDKSEQLSNWAGEKLRREQEYYAAFDAVVLSYIN